MAINWNTFEKAYAELRQRGVAHDAAADKALYLAKRGALPTAQNWGLIANRTIINDTELADNHCLPLSTLVQSDDDSRDLTLADVATAEPAIHDPERITIMLEQLAQVPDDVLHLFTDRDRPLTGTEASRISRFRKAQREQSAP